MNRTEATKAATKLCGLFPPGAASDPEIFFAGIVEIFQAYPARIVEAATHIRTGLPAKQTFLPSLAEIGQFCASLQAGEQQHQETLRRWERPKLPPPVDRSQRPTYEELKAKYGPTWGLKVIDQPKDPWTAPTDEQLLAHYARKEAAE